MAAALDLTNLPALDAAWELPLHEVYTASWSSTSGRLTIKDPTFEAEEDALVFHLAESYCATYWKAAPSTWAPIERHYSEEAYALIAASVRYFLHLFNGPAGKALLDQMYERRAVARAKNPEASFSRLFSKVVDNHAFYREGGFSAEDYTPEEALGVVLLDAVRYVRFLKLPEPSMEEQRALVPRALASPPSTTTEVILGLSPGRALWGDAVALMLIIGETDALRKNKALLDPEVLAFAGRLRHAIFQAEASPQALVKDIQGVDLTPSFLQEMEGWPSTRSSSENVAPSALNLPLHLKGFRNYLQDRTFQEVAILGKALKKDLSLPVALGVSASLLEDASQEKVLYGQAEAYTWRSMARDAEALMEKALASFEEAEGDDAKDRRLWSWINAPLDALLKKRPQTYAFLMEWANTPRAEGAPIFPRDTLTAVLLTFLMQASEDPVGFVMGGDEKELLLPLLRPTLSVDTIMGILVALKRHRHTPHLQEWKKIAELGEDVAVMPIDWWLPLVSLKGIVR